MPLRELMAKKLNAFLLANLIKLEPGGEALRQELQRRLLAGSGIQRALAATLPCLSDRHSASPRKSP
jgi:hypothetical protein